MGIKQTGVNMGGMLAAFFLPVLALKSNSWRYPCAVAGFAAFGAALLLLFLYRDPADSRVEASGGMSRYAAGFRRLLRNRDFLLVCSAGVFLMATQFAFSTYFVLYASTTLSFPLRNCGILLALAFLGGALGRVGWSLASDYLFMGKRNTVMAFVGTAGMVVSLGLVALPGTGSLFLIYLAVVVFGLTGLGWNALYLTRVGELPGRELAGTATGISFVLSNIGAILGPPLFGGLVDLTHGYTVPWLFVAFCMAMVVLLTKLQGKERMAATCEVEHG
jgi:sugar phosphate permease